MMLDQVMRELNRRKAISYAQRMQSLEQEAHVFDRCKTTRPENGKAKNRYSREEAGTIGNMVMGVRVGPHTVVVCKCRKS